MISLELREREVIKTIKELKDCNFVIIGGYAVNIYTPPRFSVDCDMVVMDVKEAKKITEILARLGYTLEKDYKNSSSYHSDFLRYEKKIEMGFIVNFDIMIGKILDRKTGASLSYEWVFDNSSNKLLKGKTVNENIEVLAPNVEALMIMKLLSCRNSDIRDIFMMASQVKDFNFIKNEVSKLADFDKIIKRVETKIDSTGFRDNLQGVFGFIPNKIFEKHKALILKLFK